SVAIDSIAHIAKKHGLLWISDSSHAFGARVGDLPVGSFADATVFSFHAIKPITTAEGGAVVFKDAEAHKKAQLLHSHGVQKKALWNSEVEFLGFNFRLNELGAALGISQYKRLDSFIAKRDSIARLYDSLLADSPFCTTLAREPHLTTTHHLYPVFLARSLWCSKETLFAQLHEKGIGAQVHYKPINSYALYGADSRATPAANDFYLSELSLPCHQEMSEEQAHEIVKTFNALCEKDSNACAT
ncbi:MAG: DegT/DnrJ/EryC1/StrS family aminotransferase, partial [Helicobacter sp.]|nr:DegT/DnrJ/EryC1/StrS family aminotransferase [Helicobacter sp.]